jgi:AraC family transcriptional regulator
MNKVDGQDTRDRLSVIVANSLDTQAKTQDLARQAYQSRTQFHRLFRTVVEETPAAMRRRLLLERAAYQLGHTGMSVTDIALDANYGSLEAFTRAFRKGFRISPSLYRRVRDLHFHLPASNKIHFCAPVLQQEEEVTWIYSIVLQAMTLGTHAVCWNMREL